MARICQRGVCCAKIGAVVQRAANGPRRQTDSGGDGRIGKGDRYLLALDRIVISKSTAGFGILPVAPLKKKPAFRPDSAPRAARRIRIASEFA